MSFIENANSLELTFSDGVVKIISLEGKSLKEKTAWRDWAKKLYESNTFVSGWEIS